MNKLILCEGVTDAILLSYYLGKVAGWRFCKGPRDLAIKTANDNESVSWYKRGDDYLLICGVGGKDNFGNFFETRIKKPIIDSNAFEKIVIVTDRDNRTVEEITEDILQSVTGISGGIQDRSWCPNEYVDSYGMKKGIDILLLVIPKEHQGALETVMLDAIAENSYDKNIIDKVDIFIQQMRTEASHYITTDRLQLKAKLGVTWAVQFPEKVFSLIDEQIRNVHWEKYEVLRECFGMLIGI